MLAHQYIAQLKRALAVGGTLGKLMRAKDPAGTPLPIRFLLKHPGVRDEAIVNSYGVDALILTIEVQPALVQLPPEKFDRVIFDDPSLPATPYSYALSDVLVRQVNNVPVAFTAYVKGKGT